MFKSQGKKVAIIGLDCAGPQVLFDKLLPELPNLKHMLEKGVAGKLRTCYPPVTIPAWMVMATGKDPAQLGVYGFRYRRPEDYQDFHITTSRDIKVPKIWDYLAEQGKKSILVGIPPSYPTYKVNGCLVGGFMTPSVESEFAYPSTLKGEIQQLVGEYKFDVLFRTEQRDKLREDLFDMTERHFKVIEYLLRKKEWDFFQCVEIGVDRAHHAFWKFFDEEHHLYRPNNEFSEVIKDYYKLLDEKIGRIRDILDKNTTVVVVSDHGVKRMKGCFCINEWLIEKGYLVLKKYPPKVSRFEDLEVDWDKTQAWGWGGYYARVFINKQGREPQGMVSEGQYEGLRDKLKREIEEICGPKGEEWNTVVHKPEEFYKDPQGYYSDLMVYFDDLYYRSAGTVGRKTLFLEENDTGPDDAMHDWEGIIIKYDPANPLNNSSQKIGQYNIQDICPTILEEFNLSPKPSLPGEIIRSS